MNVGWGILLLGRKFIFQQNYTMTMNFGWDTLPKINDHGVILLENEFST